MIRPLFPYYGSKWRDARRYPAPGAHVVEPFAGSAGYALWHEPAQVTLLDADPIIVAVWRYLITADPADILALPDLTHAGESVDDHPDLPDAARWLIGFWLNRGSAQPKRTRTAYSARTDRAQLTWSARARERIAEALPRIRHWSIEHADYSAAPLDASATYFIDPPYADRGRYYRHHAVDYPALAAWVERLPGVAISCENAGATWLPFEPLASVKSSRGRSLEVVYVQGAPLAQLGLLT